MNSKLAYSSDQKGVKQKTKDSKKKASYKREEGPIKMRRETKGRAGKSVTVLGNLPLEEVEAKSLMKELQTFLGCGATLKNSCIEIRGDKRDDIEVFIQKKGLKIIRAGG